MKASITGAISAKAQEMRASGIRVYNFAAGDPVLPNHPLLLQTARQALQEGYSPYAPIAGLIDLRRAAADWMNRRYNASFQLDETVVTVGGKFGIYAALQILVQPGDGVLIPAPYWVSYPEIIHFAKGTPIPIQTRWKLTPELLKKHITAKSRVLILNNACNPTGILYTQEELAELLHIAHQANLFIISDEVYSELVFDDAPYISCASFPEYRSKTLIIESCSKNFAMAGWRVGFALGPKDLINAIIALQSQSTTGTSYISQKVALTALKHSAAISAYVRNTLAKRRKLFFDTYNRLFHTSIVPPPASVYFFAPIDNTEDILTKAHVALVPGIAFGVPSYSRFAFTESEENIVSGLESLAKYLK